VLGEFLGSFWSAGGRFNNLRYWCYAALATLAVNFLFILYLGKDYRQGQGRFLFVSIIPLALVFGVAVEGAVPSLPRIVRKASTSGTAAAVVLVGWGVSFSGWVLLQLR
jgi:hypothetical protein